MSNKVNQQDLSSGRFDEIDLPESHLFLIKMVEKYGIFQILGGIFGVYAQNLWGRVSSKSVTYQQNGGEN